MLAGVSLSDTGRKHTIHQRAPCQAGNDHPIRGGKVLLQIHAQAIIGKDTRDRPDSPVTNELAHRQARWEKSRPETLHQEALLGLGNSEEFRCLGRADREGLLAEDVLAVVEGSHDILKVVRVGGGNVDDVNTG